MSGRQGVPAGGVQLDLFGPAEPAMPPGAKASQCPYCFHTYGTHADGCARLQRGLEIRHTADGAAWLATYWASSRPFRGRFKAMTASRSGRSGRGFRQDVSVTRPVCLPGEIQ